uniref:NADH dehydrogenase [ubiquinone] 1 alpha subcomplex subunit 3 n=1 Tax=Capra hircus TaxID=9925 RepID=A0A8C2PJ57_CAPHI
MAERIAAFLKNVCAKELVLVASFTSGGLPVILPTLSPNTKYLVMFNGPYPKKQNYNKTQKFHFLIYTQKN